MFQTLLERFVNAMQHVMQKNLAAGLASNKIFQDFAIQSPNYQIALEKLIYK